MLDNQRRALTSAPAAAAASAPGSLPSRHGAGETGGAREEGCLPEFPLLTFNLGTRCLGVQRALRSAAGAAGALYAEGKHKPQEPPPQPAGLGHPLRAQTPRIQGSHLVSLRLRPRRWEGEREGGRSQGGRRASGEEREIRLLGGLLIWMAF